MNFLFNLIPKKGTLLRRYYSDLGGLGIILTFLEYGMDSKYTTTHLYLVFICIFLLVGVYRVVKYIDATTARLTMKIDEAANKNDKD